jgi:hypothetical protein
MSISGLVITLSGDEALAGRALAAVTAEPRLMLGPVDGRRLPAVLEAREAGEDREVFEWLRSLEGVALVDVVYVDFGDQTPPGGMEAGAGREESA